MVDKIVRTQVQFHMNKVEQLQREKQTRLHAGERRIQKMQEDLNQELSRLQLQIDDHARKAGDINKLGLKIDST